jgi:hypothetical protein
MPTYRAFLLNADGRICRAIEVEADEDPEAHARVRSAYEPFHGYELWLGDRMVPPLSRQDNPEG